jgi:hypothetical protein
VNLVLTIKQVIGECDTGSTCRAIADVTAVPNQEGAVVVDRGGEDSQSVVGQGFRGYLSLSLKERVLP